MVLAAMFAALVMVGGVAYAATLVGTDKDDTLNGTNEADNIRGLGDRMRLGATKPPMISTADTGPTRCAAAEGKTT